MEISKLLSPGAYKCHKVLQKNIILMYIIGSNCKLL